jgi:hypothetical protein
MPDVVPSIRYGPDDPRPIGFLEEVTDAHLTAVGAALRQVCDVVASVAAPAGTQPLRIRLCSTRYSPGFPFNLFAFNVVDFDEAGAFADAISAGGEITYALVANHAVEVQTEVALLFLFELVQRQQALKELLASDNPVADQVSATSAQADDEARKEFADRIRSGWAHTAKAAAQRAVAAGFSLDLRYEVDVLPTRESVVRRIPMLRAAYNDIDLAREVIDKTVAMIGGKDPRFSVRGLSPLEEGKLQRQFVSMDVRHWVSQTTRDAEVCGNGYLVTAADPYPTLYTLRPEEVEVLGKNEFRLVGPDGSRPISGHVLHIPGIEQFESPYGISFLEPVLAEYRTLRVFQEATAFARQLLQRADAGSRERAWAEATLGAAERNVRLVEEKLGQLLWYPRDWLQEAPEGLYFPGQERM